ncbi:MAG TPA: histidine phosphatase family protein, partial [Candidatus Dormibacteraeota bacterium]|nr:histidine phosphatase family protein [Candidatus Dormibacteraeota bacterium]
PELRLDPELREMNFGAWEGLTFEEISRRWPDEAERFRRREPVAPPRGETWSAFETRVWGGFERHRAAAAAGGDLLLVVHGGVIHALLGRVLRLGGGPVPLHLDPAAVTELECEGDALRVSILNDRRHLDGFP